MGIKAATFVLLSPCSNQPSYPEGDGMAGKKNYASLRAYFPPVQRAVVGDEDRSVKGMARLRIY